MIWTNIVKNDISELLYDKSKFKIILFKLTNKKYKILKSIYLYSHNHTDKRCIEKLKSVSRYYIDGDTTKDFINELIVTIKENPRKSAMQKVSEFYINVVGKHYKEMKENKKKLDDDQK